MTVAIKLDGESLRLVFSGKPTSSQLSQLYYWGFIRTPGTNEWTSSSIESNGKLLVTLTEFFDEEAIVHTCTKEIASLLQEEHSRREAVVDLMKAGLNAKAGTIAEEALHAIRETARLDLKRTLRDHQFKAAVHLYIVQNGANFSVPGSGKSSVVLTVYQLLRKRGKVNRLFVVGPASCFGPWKKEFLDTLGRTGKPRVLAGLQSLERRAEYFRSHDNEDELFLTSFQSLANDQTEVAQFFNHTTNNVMLVVDEAHYCKQVGGVWAEAVLQVSRCAVFRYVVTGTPMPNSYEDVFNLIDILWGRNCVLTIQDKHEILQAQQLHDALAAKKVLDKKIGPFFYRVRKKDLGLKEQVFNEPTMVKMNERERTLYDAIVTRIGQLQRSDYLKEAEVISRLKKGRLMRLRQCMSYSKMLSNAVQDYDEDICGGESHLLELIRTYDSHETPAKALRLTEIAGGIVRSGKKVVVWANFVETLKLLSRLLANAGIKNKMIYGAIPTEQTATDEEESREAIRDEFVNPTSGLNVLLANPAACAESISLHKNCQHAIYYDLSFNAAQYLQSLDRIHRVGGSETMPAYYDFLQYDDTCDADIKSALDAKAVRMSLVIDDDYPVYSLDMFAGTSEDDQLYRKVADIAHGNEGKNLS